MKKFEIINNKWIKANNDHPSLESSTTTLKINSISIINCNIHKEALNIIGLMGSSSSVSIQLNYKKDELELFENDLKILEDLLYNQ